MGEKCNGMIGGAMEVCGWRQFTQMPLTESGQAFHEVEHARGPQEGGMGGSHARMAWKCPNKQHKC